MIIWTLTSYDVKAYHFNVVPIFYFYFLFGRLHLFLPLNHIELSKVTGIKRYKLIVFGCLSTKFWEQREINQIVFITILFKCRYETKIRVKRECHLFHLSPRQNTDIKIYFWVNDSLPLIVSDWVKSHFCLRCSFVVVQAVSRVTTGFSFS